MNDIRYIRGSESNAETVEFDLRKRNGDYLTTCSVNVDLLVCGISAFPCGNGNDYKLNGSEKLEILEFVTNERKKITDGATVKSLKGWHESGLNQFELYCFPGDEVDEDIVDHFVNSLPPTTMQSGYIQDGEPYSHEADSTGKRFPTYATFKKINGKWIFLGYCFRNGNENRADERTALDRLIEATVRGLEAD